MPYKLHTTRVAERQEIVKNFPLVVKTILICVLPMLMLFLIALHVMHTDEQNEIETKTLQIEAIETEVRDAQKILPHLLLTYDTYLGPGIAAGWQDPDFFGNTLKIQGALNTKIQEGEISYTFNNLQGHDNLSLMLALGFLTQDIKAFRENSVFVAGIFERKFTENLSLSVGPMLQWMKVNKAANFNGTFDLLKSPIHLRWQNIDDPNNPSNGVDFQLNLVPSFQFMNSNFAYLMGTLSGRLYKSFTESKRHIFSLKFMIGSILTRNGQSIPPPDLFYAGSQTTLRGYNYWTVSPMSPTGQPIGGFSMIIFSVELANRISKDFGMTIFYDAGNVYANTIPNFSQNGLLQSAGFGIWYYTPIGPIRLEAAFPLDKRSIDKAVGLYFRMGQSF